MSAVTGYTLQEATEMLNLWKECERALASGQTKSYKIGSMEYTALDLDQIASRIQFWQYRVEALTGNSRKNRVVRVIPRDL